MKVRFAFYKAKDAWGKVISNWTGLFNRGLPPYCHVEIGFLIDGVWKYYSSASKTTNSRSGTRWLDEAVLLKYPENWDIYEVEAIRSLEDMVKICTEQLEKDYDWAGIFGFVTLFGYLNARERWYCSEICNYIFYGIWKRRISPKGLFARLKREKRI